MIWVFKFPALSVQYRQKIDIKTFFMIIFKISTCNQFWFVLLCTIVENVYLVTVILGFDTRVAIPNNSQFVVVFNYSRGWAETTCLSELLRHDFKQDVSDDLHIINTTMHRCLEIWHLFLVLNEISLSFGLLTREIITRIKYHISAHPCIIMYYYIFLYLYCVNS